MGVVCSYGQEHDARRAASHHLRLPPRIRWVQHGRYPFGWKDHRSWSPQALDVSHPGYLPPLDLDGVELSEHLDGSSRRSTAQGCRESTQRRCPVLIEKVVTVLSSNSNNNRLEAHPCWKGTPHLPLLQHTVTRQPSTSQHVTPDRTSWTARAADTVHFQQTRRLSAQNFRR